MGFGAGAARGADEVAGAVATGSAGAASFGGGSATGLAGRAGAEDAGREPDASRDDVNGGSEGRTAGFDGSFGPSPDEFSGAILSSYANVKTFPSIDHKCNSQHGITLQGKVRDQFQMSDTKHFWNNTLAMLILYR